MEEADLFIPMVTYTKANGKMIKHTGEEYTTITMVRAIQANGSKMFNKVTEYRNGLMVHHIRGIKFQ